MIFATVGSSHIPFERLMRALDALPAAELVVQHGPAQATAAARATAFMPFDELAELVEAADVVVSHAGVGSILCAIRAGHTPIVLPRLERFGETVDDHQLELAEALDRQGRIVSLGAAADLADAVAAARPRTAPSPPTVRPIHAAVRAALRGEPVPPA